MKTQDSTTLPDTQNQHLLTSLILKLVDAPPHPPPQPHQPPPRITQRLTSPSVRIHEYTGLNTTLSLGQTSLSLPRIHSNHTTELVLETIKLPLRQV